MRLLRPVLKSPARVTAVGFALLIAVGTGLLLLPWAARGEGLGLVDALFTATSAVCVTGLTVVDTGSYFSIFGQGVLLLLIQVGGLGIMTLSTLFLLLAGRRPSFTEHTVIQSTFARSQERSLGAIIRDVAVFTFVLEGLGVLLLFFFFLPQGGVAQSLYRGFFHAVSAFCNAGFGLFADSFSAYRTHWGINLTVAALIVAGGLGFPVLSELRYRLQSGRRRFWRRLSFHTKLVLVTSALLLLLGTLLIVVMEWNNTLQALAWPQRFLAAFFQAVNARTSGFNSLPMGGMTNVTLFVLILLMFVGASPGSCGGGIKTTTFATLALVGFARFRGRPKPQLFGRSIARKSNSRAVSIVLLSTLVISIGLVLLLMTELGDTPHPQSRGKFLELLFEVVSAFGTVGLSTGLTAQLSVAGKLIVSFVMFIGRLGPLLVAMAVSRPETATFYYAEESIMVG